jgi:hypothetical protein
MKYIITENKLDRVALTWLNNNFGDLTPVVKVDKTYYVNEDRLPLFYYVQDSKNDNVFINYHEIWSFLESMFGMEYQQIQGVIRDWLEETYNLKGITPKSILIPIHQRLEPIPSNSIFFEVLEETYNLKEMKYIITENKLDRIALTWLNNNFGDLKPIVKEYKTYYVNDDESPLFFYYQYRKYNDVYINYDKIWSVLETMFGMKSLQIKVVIRKWLEESYNLKDLTPINWWREIIVELDETYNFKKEMKYIITENKLDKVALTWLNNNFGDLTPIVKEYKTYYVNEDRLPLFYYFQNSKNDNVYINYYKIWSFLESMFGMEHQQIQGVIRDWLEETYNLKGITPVYFDDEETRELEETYNLKKK